MSLARSFPSPSLPTARIPSSRAPSPRVLVVDDDVADAEQLAVALGDRLGADVVVRPDAYQALDVLLNERVDVALVDLFMPGATGLQLVDRLRKTGSTTPVIIMTELATSKLVAEVEAWPGTTLVEKTPDTALIAAVQATTAKTTAPRPEETRGGGRRPEQEEAKPCPLRLSGGSGLTRVAPGSCGTRLRPC